jgi:hypothetical protein
LVLLPEWLSLTPLLLATIQLLLLLPLLLELCCSDQQAGCCCLLQQCTPVSTTALVQTAVPAGQGKCIQGRQHQNPVTQMQHY